MIERGIAPIAGVRETFTAIACAAAIGDAWGSPREGPLVGSECLPTEPILLDEATAKTRLAEYGVEVPRGAVARTVDEAAAVADSLDGPVVVKALGVAHKTERGAVRLGLRERAGFAMRRAICWHSAAACWSSGSRPASWPS